ncbi:MAG: T9SS type A sorting domain-containing protein [Bacteroidaceae bacterium]|nr:T9SS type A sorting domain-containing protein [Bacteroidaceae bacterium]
MKKLSILCAALLVAVSAIAEKGAMFITSPELFQVMAMSPNGKWACGNYGDGTSIMQGVLWNLENGEVTYLSTIDESSAYGVTDEGVVCGGYTDYTLHDAGLGVYVAGVYKNGQWNRLDNAGFENQGVIMYGSEATAISADGRVVVGYVQAGPSDSNLAPARWVDGKLERLFSYTKAGVCYAITRDGSKATGWGYQADEDGDMNRSIAVWEGDAVEYLSPAPTFAEAGRAFSPNGQKIVCESFGHKFTYDFETKEKVELPWVSPACWGQNVAYISNDGLVLGGENFQNEATGASGFYGYVYEPTSKKAYKFDEWLKSVYNVEIDKNSFMTQYAMGMSDDAKTFILCGYPLQNGMATGAWASMAIKLDQEVTYCAPVSLKAEKLLAVNNVRLTWAAPLMNAENVLGYRIYRNDEMINEVSADLLAYMDAQLAEAEYTYAISAIYADENDEIVESEKCSSVTIVVAKDPLNQVQNVECKSTNYNDMRLRWNAPASNLPSMKYYDLNSTFTGFGGGVISFLTAIKLPTDMIEIYSQTHSIVRVGFFPINKEAIYTVRVIVDGVEKGAKTVETSTLSMGEVNLVDLDTPVSFDALSDVLVVVDVDASNFTMASNEVIGAIYGDVTPGYSDLLRQASESEFYSIYETSKAAGYDMPITWIISAILSETGSAVASDVVLGYDIYRNDELVGTTTEQNFYDEGLANGDITYGIVAKYSVGESEPATVNVKYECNPKALKAVEEVEVQAGTSEMAAFWQAPLKNDESVVSYAMGQNTGRGMTMSGATELIEYTVAHAYPFSILDWYEGYTVDALRFFPNGEATFAIALEVNGVDHEMIVLGQVGDEDGYVLNTWNNIRLEKPYTIKNGDYIRVKLLCTDVDPSTYPIALDDQVGAMGVSDLYCWDYYGNYSSVLSDGGYSKGNWMLGMLVSNGSTELLPVKGYDVMLDGELAAEMVAENEFKTSGYNWNDGSTHRIKVNTVYKFDQEVVVDGKQVVFNVKAGVESIEINRVNVYPNPATSYINVEGAVEKIALFDMNGRLVAETAENTLDVTALVAGNYMLNIYNNGNVRTVKVVIVR